MTIPLSAEDYDGIAPRYFGCMANLVPEVRVDKNGKSVVRHVRSDSASPTGGMKSVPAPRVGNKKQSVDGIFSEVSDLMSVLNLEAPAKKRITKIIEKTDPQDIHIVRDALTGFESASAREQEFIRRALYLAIPDGTLCEKLSLRSSFSGDWSRDSPPPMVNMNTCIYAVREMLNGDDEKPLELNNPEYMKKAHALTEFIFESRHHFAETEHPLVFQVTKGKSKRDTLRFVSSDFVGLVLDHRDRVRELLTLVQDRKTSNPDLLRELMEREGPSAVSSGYL